MLQRVVSPVLVGRQEELSQLEDALLSANRGDGRFILLAGEAGIGKTRLAAELTQRARKLGFDVLRGSCSESELALPYLPFVEAVGNRLDEADAVALRAALGPTAGELAQLFPQLAEGAPRPPAGDPAQAKQRLFESFVTLLDLWARDRGLVLVLDDIHWADSSTRELLDYVARRLVRSRVMLLAVHRSDELDRRHPLTRVIQIWRRAGLADTVTVAPMTARNVAELVAAILNAERVGPDLVALVDAHAEGNPFVLEEMLREALDRGEIFRTDAGWQRRSADALPMPETVRDAVLLRLGRLPPEQIDVLRAAAVLGRSFDYALLVHVAQVQDDVVLAALEAAVAQQLLEEAARGGDQYRWRHALTEEAIASDTVVPKRQRIHSRAADALAGGRGSALALARHLLESGRMQEAVDACMRAAREAERAVAFTEAAELLERVLPHVADPRERALLHARMGQLRWLSGEPAAGEQLLEEGVRQLDELGYGLDAARARLHLGRCRWELDRPDLALADFERAREVLEQEGPSSDLALAYIRISGLHAFQLDYRRCREAAERAAVIAEQADADFERIWALSHAAIGLFGTSREFDLLDRCYREAVDKGYAIIAGNILYNETWDRVQTLAGGLDATLAKLEHVPDQLSILSGGLIARSLALLAHGEPRAALESARKATVRHESLGATKFAWRSRLAAAEALVELGRPEEAAAELPPPAPGNELQDIVYDTPARVGIALALGRVDEAVELARRVAGADPVLVFRATAAVAVDALVRSGHVTEAEALLGRARGARGDLGDTGLDLAEGQILLASGDAAAARPHLERAVRDFEAKGLRVWGWRAGALAAEAAARSGDGDAASAHFAACVHAAHLAGAVRLRDDALAAAADVGVDVAAVAEEPACDVREPDLLAAGERFVTSVFADVRGSTPLAAASSPEELADRLTTLHRWAATEVGRRQGIVDKFAGDAVMATFNAAGARVDHTVLALEAALALRDKAALMDLPIGIGIAVGPAVVTRSVAAGNVSVLGQTTNLAARLQAAAAGNEIVLSDEAFRRVAAWLLEHGLAADPELLELKGFAAAQPAYRLRAPLTAA
ncbi:MAG TPA: AAA family ATPase [Gaiellales bacterium]